MGLNRRGFLTGLVSALAAPAIVHACNLMPVKSVDLIEPHYEKVRALMAEDVMRVIEQMQRHAIEDQLKLFVHPSVASRITLDNGIFHLREIPEEDFYL